MFLLVLVRSCWMLVFIIEVVQSWSDMNRFELCHSSKGGKRNRDTESRTSSIHQEQRSIATRNKFGYEAVYRWDTQKEKGTSKELTKKRKTTTWGPQIQSVLPRSYWSLVVHRYNALLQLCILFFFPSLLLLSLCPIVDEGVTHLGDDRWLVVSL